MENRALRKHSTLSELTFRCAYILCLTDSFLVYYSTIGELPGMGRLSAVLKATSLALVLLKTLMDRYYRVNELLFIAAAGAITVVSYLKSGYNHLFYFAITAVGMHRMNVERLLKVDFAAKAVLCLMILSACLLGLSENYATHRTGEYVVRYSLGFSHPNTLASVAFMFLLEDAVLKRRRFSFGYLLATWCAGGAIYWVTRNRTSVALMMLLPIGLAVFRPDRAPGRLSKSRRALLTLLYPATALAAYGIMCATGGTGHWVQLDAALSGRFSNALRLFKRYGISLAGQSVRLTSVKAARALSEAVALLDVAPLRVLIQGGLLATLFQTELYAQGMYRLSGRQDRYPLFAAAVYILYGLFESGANNICLNFSLLYLIEAAYGERDNLCGYWTERR